jgi:hypothetical protein
MYENIFFTSHGFLNAFSLGFFLEKKILAEAFCA